MEHIRFSAAACQTDMPKPIDRRQMRSNTDRMLAMIEENVRRIAASKQYLEHSAGRIRINETT